MSIVLGIFCEQICQNGVMNIGLFKPQKRKKAKQDLPYCTKKAGAILLPPFDCLFRTQVKTDILLLHTVQ